MTDGWIEGESEPPRRSRLGLLAGIAGGVVVLAAVGATGGWLLAGGNSGNQGARGSSQPPPTSYLPPSPSPSPSYSEPSPAESTTPDPGEFPLPDVTGDDFIAARRQLRELKLGVQVVFDGKGDDHVVERTSPRAGESVHAGVTVKLRVRGAPPPLQVPLLVGKTCAAAGRGAADSGLVPQYKPEKAGRVARQEPRPYAEARWNDKITLYCVGGTTP